MTHGDLAFRPEGTTSVPAESELRAGLVKGPDGHVW